MSSITFSGKGLMWRIIFTWLSLMNITFKQGNLGDLIAATGLVILLESDSYCWYFSLCDLEIWWMSSTNNRAPLLHYIKLSVSFQTPRWSQTEVTVWKPSIRRVKICNCFVPCDLEFWWITLKSNMAPLLCCFKLHAWFHSHQGTQTKVTVRKRSIQVKISHFCPVWPWNLMDDLEKIEHLFYATSSFAHHFIAIGEFKLQLQSKNAIFG